MNGTPGKSVNPPLGTQVKAVTFDVGGTLIKPWPSVGHVYAEVAARHDMKTFSPEQLNARFKAAWRARQSFEHSRTEWAALVDEVFDHSIPPGGKFFSELYDRFAQPDAWHLFEDVVPTLKTLADAGIRLGIISNWDERLRGLLRRLNLDPYFETIAISREVGFPKPSRAIFAQAALDLDLRAGSILHVGDSLEMDVEGARAADFQALQIHRHGGPPEEMLSLAELPGRIAQPPS